MILWRKNYAHCFSSFFLHTYMPLLTAMILAALNLASPSVHEMQNGLAKCIFVSNPKHTFWNFAQSRPILIIPLLTEKYLERSHKVNRARLECLILLSTWLMFQSTFPMLSFLSGQYFCIQANTKINIQFIPTSIIVFCS